jgi:hypothetical protein
VARNRNYYQVIERRRWHDIRSWWSAHIPVLVDVGQPPNPTLSEFFTTTETGSNTSSRVRTVMPGVHEIAMTEAIFLFQKSMHVARAVEASARKGMLSWAVFQGYHSAYYAAKGFLLLLGACFPQPAGRQLLVDLFPIQMRRQPQFGGEDEEIIVTNCAMLEQNLLWGFFGRLLRVTEFASDFRKHLVFLEGIDHAHISRPRNRFIYHESHWPYADLIDLQKVADFAFRGSLETDLADIEEDNPLFLAVLGMVIPSLLRLMFDELMDRVPALSPHITYMDSPDWHAETQMIRSYF